MSSTHKRTILVRMSLQGPSISGINMPSKSPFRGKRENIFKPDFPFQNLWNSNTIPFQNLWNTDTIPFQSLWNTLTLSHFKHYEILTQSNFKTYEILTCLHMYICSSIYASMHGKMGPLTSCLQAHVWMCGVCPLTTERHNMNVSILILHKFWKYCVSIS